MKKNALIILKLVNPNLQDHIIGRRKSVLYVTKKDVGHRDILGKSVISQKIDGMSDSVNILIEKRKLSILLTSKERSQVKTMILMIKI